MAEQLRKMKSSRRRGSGSIFRRDGCKTWTVQYFVDGKRVREKTSSEDRSAATRLLTRRLYQISRGEVPVPDGKPLRVQQLWDRVVDSYKRDGKVRAVRDFGTAWKHLKPYFELIPVRRISTEDVEKYIQKRQEEKAAPATINHEVKKLERCFRLALRWTPPVIDRVPYMPKLKVQNTRTGFLEDSDFDRLTQATAVADRVWFRCLLELAFTYGFRRGELLGLQVGQVDLRNNVIRLEPGTTKNKEGRAVVMTPKVLELVVACIGKKDADAALFTRKNGKPVREFRWTWYAAAVACGLGKLTCPLCKKSVEKPSHRCPHCKQKVALKYTGRILHDMRRSAARQLRLAGVAETVIMAAGGWKTQSVFKRYAIVSHADQAQAMEKLVQARAARSQSETAPITAPIASKTAQTPQPRPLLVTVKVQ